MTGGEKTVAVGRAVEVKVGPRRMVCTVTAISGRDVTVQPERGEAFDVHVSRVRIARAKKGPVSGRARMSIRGMDMTADGISAKAMAAMLADAHAVGEGVPVGTVIARRVAAITASGPAPDGRARRKPPGIRPSFEAIINAATLRDPDHLSFVREFPCAACSAPAPSQAHHFGPRGMGEKTDDTRTVPLCGACHDGFHTTGRLRIGGRVLFRLETERLFYLAQVDVCTAWRKRELLYDAARST